MHGAIALQKRLYQIISPHITLFVIEVTITIEKPDSTTLMRDIIIPNGVDLSRPIVLNILIPILLMDLIFMHTVEMTLSIDLIHLGMIGNGIRS